MGEHIFRNIVLGMAFLAACSLTCYAAGSFQDLETAVVQQDYQKARELASGLLSDASVVSQRDGIHYYLGLCELRLGHYETAREFFNALVRIKENDRLRDRAYLGLFDTYYFEGDYEKAYLKAKHLIKVSPKSEFLSLAYLKYARANLKLAQWRRAREYLERIIDQFPDSLEVYIARQLLNEKQYFAVQVGAFNDRERAQQLSDVLQGEGEYAYIIEVTDQQDKKFYRVRVGQLALLKEAQKLESKLSAAGYPTLIYP